MSEAKIETIIAERIGENIPNAEVFVRDMYNDGEHFESVVISSAFEGIPLVKQHQMVMTALKEAFQTSVHALKLKTFTPTKWKEVHAEFKWTEKGPCWHKSIN